MVRNTLTLIILLSLSLVIFGSTSQHLKWLHAKPVLTSTEGILQTEPDRSEGGFQKLMADLQRVHKAVFELPYDYEHIRTVLMPEIEAQRKVIAPHYPSRETTGSNQDLVYQMFREWYMTYPQECAAYIAYVEDFVDAHDN